jgi:hypothetical protein
MPPKRQQPMHRKAIVVDTNALHYALLFLQLARDHGLRPFGKNRRNVERLIEQEFKGQRAVGNVKKGRVIVSYLGDQCERRRSNPAVVWYSPVSRLELASGLLRGRAVENAAQGGLPRRWSSVLDEEVRSWLSGEDYGWAYNQTTDLEAMFEKAGVDLHESERALEPGTWRLADRILRHVFVGWADALILSCALLEKADEVLTYDSYLYRLLECLPDLKKEQSRELRGQLRRLRTEVRAFVPRDRGEPKRKVQLPAPKRAPKLLTQ